MTPAKILIVKPSSLGDVVHALPAVARIRRQFPNAHIAWVINRSLASLLRHSPVADELILFDRERPVHFVPLLWQIRRGYFDTVVDLQGLLRSAVMSWAAGAPRRIGLSDAREGARLFYNEVVAVSRAHAVARYLRAADHLGCANGTVEFPLGIRSQPREGWIAIHPFARWPSKHWGDDRFAELVRRLPRERVVVTGTLAERERAGKIAPGCRNEAGNTDLYQLAELYARCAVLVTNDSGPMHIAAAVGTPVVALFGATDPGLTGPYGPQHMVLRAGVSCSPCFRRRCRHWPRMECMKKLSVEDVLRAVSGLLAVSGVSFER
ncbi:MAG: glycosyltransferase family 9 protein [Verrucomicrobiae bacterium]|nr:glycosyltransferase family 9 protein [Verrucomicrobiae bacterium]